MLTASRTRKMNTAGARQQISPTARMTPFLPTDLCRKPLFRPHPEKIRSCGFERSGLRQGLIRSRNSPASSKKQSVAAVVGLGARGTREHHRGGAVRHRDEGGPATYLKPGNVANLGIERFGEHYGWWRPTPGWPDPGTPAFGRPLGRNGERRDDDQQVHQAQ